jgi:hypothetical protein
MQDGRKVMEIAVIAAVLIIIVRILLEQAGAPLMVNNIFGVAWLYFIVPVLLATAIRARGYANPYGRPLKDVLLFAVYTRIMVAITYVLAYYLKWTAPRFEVSKRTAPLPLRNMLVWAAAAAIIGMIIGSITLLLIRRKQKPAPAA